MKDKTPIILLILSIIWFSCQPVVIDRDGKGTLQTIQMTHIMDTPSFNGTRLATIDKNEQLVLVYQQGDWYRVRLPNGLEGWIHKTLVKTTSYQAVAIREDIELRWKPTDSSPLSQIVPAGSQLRILQETDDWYLIETVDSRNMGWVRRADLQKAQTSTSRLRTGGINTALYNERNVMIVTLDNVHLRNGPSMASNIITTLPSGTILAWHDSVDEWFHVTVSENGQEGYVHYTLVTQQPYRTIYNTQESNLRAGPSTEFMQIDRLYPNTSLTLLYTYEDWHLVQKSDGRLAWIYANLTNEPGAGPSPSYSEVTLIEKKNFGHFFTTSQVEVYADRSFSGSRLGSLPAGQQIEVVSENISDWYQIEFGNRRRGFVQAQNVTAVRRKAVMTNARVNFRDSPGTNTTSIDQLEPGTFALLIDVNRGWCRILVQKRDGWVSGEYLIPSRFHSLFVEKDNSPYQTDARTYSAETGRLRKGEEIYFLQKVNDWYQFKLFDSNSIVWIHERDVTVPKYGYGVAVETSTIHQGPGPQYPAHSDRLNVNDYVPLLNQALGWYEIMVPGRRLMGWIQGRAIKPGSMRPLITINDTDVLAGPAAGSRRILRIGRGSELFEFQAYSGWIHVKVSDGPIGWVNARDAIPTKYGQMTVSGGTKVYFGPSTEYAVRSQLPSRVPVETLDYEGNWYQISYQGIIGWIYSR